MQEERQRKSRSRQVRFILPKTSGSPRTTVRDHSPARSRQRESRSSTLISAGQSNGIEPARQRPQTSGQLRSVTVCEEPEKLANHGLFVKLEERTVTIQGLNMNKTEIYVYCSTADSVTVHSANYLQSARDTIGKSVVKRGSKQGQGSNSLLQLEILRTKKRMILVKLTVHER